MDKSPLKLKDRTSPDLRLGIKSSFKKYRPTIAALYIIYCANNSKCTINISKEEKNTIVLSDYLRNLITSKYPSFTDEIINLINEAPLFVLQLEPLQVTLGSFLRLAKIEFYNEDFPSSKERTGGKRYNKKISFTEKMIILDLLLKDYNEDTISDFLISWLKNEDDESTLSLSVRKLLTIFSEDCIFKTIQDNREDLIFNQESIYKILANGDNVVFGQNEKVGPLRALLSFITEGMHPMLTFQDKTLVSQNMEDISNYKDFVSTGLDLIPRNLPKIGINNTNKNKESLQQIFYGAPGTGKSHIIREFFKRENTSKENIFRTTFHPDSDYSTFVGAYKPTMKERYLYEANSKVKYPEHGDSAQANKDVPIIENVIEYSFVAQTFLQAYIRAYNETEENIYLVIEEINRGNCAQIFGDLFQLLDRNEEGKSDYTIKADADLRKYLVNELGKDSDGIKNGELCLPPNLYIWATMNTSDQSLFPIDSAFKRRWEWKYIKINNAEENWKIGILNDDSEYYDWWNFIEHINHLISTMTSSADKQIGYFFCKPDNKEQNGNVIKIITTEKFVGKVLFYLWNDVFKDYGFDNGELFKYEKNINGNIVTSDLTFPDFYKEDKNGKTIVDDEVVKQFIDNVIRFKV